MRSCSLFRMIIMCWVCAILTLNAKTIGYEALTSFYLQPSEAYHLKEEVLAFELRRYQHADAYKNYTVIKGIYRIPKYQIASRVRKNFDMARPNLSRESDIVDPSNYKEDVYRGFILYKNGKVVRLNEIADIVACLNGVDTVAEAQFVVWLHLNSIGEEHVKKWKSANTHLRMEFISQKYKKSKQGYGIMLDFFVTDTVNNVSQNFVDSMIITSKGEMIHHKELKKGKIQYIYPEACGYSIIQNEK